MTDLAAGAGAGADLEDGTRPTTPDGDNLVLDYARTEAVGFGVLVAANGGRVFDDDVSGLHLRDLGSPSPFGNPALLTRPVEPGADEAAVASVHAFYRARPGGPFLVFSPWRTGDWTALGMQRVGHPPLMFRPAGGTVPTADGIRVVEVGDEATLADFERTLVEAYPTPELQPWRPWAIFSPGVLGTDWHLYVAYDGDRPVATAGCYVGPAITLVEFVSTRPECRGRGVGAAVTLAASLAAPAQPAMLISSDLGNGVYRRLGYLPLQRYTMWLGVR